ncbi:hypothetical protein LSH36_902g01012 [Paralvinella palmiformis]|uniref:Uncharacterized protein n=1 Tax=Paralvinella palmiformis TaxID=53620 RepID=A0AAD9IYU9_9ANNE|nr:hypothetical protein LSH36_902g01012 [Paralvinella palmiformis]
MMTVICAACLRIIRFIGERDTEAPISAFRDKSPSENRALGRGHIAYGKTIHVYHESDRAAHSCGASPQSACANLTAALRLAEENDIISLHGDGVTWLCDQGSPEIAVSVRIVADTGSKDVNIGCRTANHVVLVNVTNSRAKVVFENINFHQTFFLVQAGHVVFSQCTLRISKWFTLRSTGPVRLDILDSVWIGELDNDVQCTVDCIPKGYIELHSNEVTLNVVSSRFYQSRVNISVAERANISVIDTLFSSLPDRTTVFGGMYIILQDETQNSTVLVRNSTFENQINTNPIESVMNVFIGTFNLMTGRPYKQGRTSNVVAVIEDSVFRNNERGMTFVGPYRSLNITGSYFADNVPMHAGAGILIFVTPSMPGQQRVLITNCTFDNNAAGMFRPKVVENYKDSFIATGDEVRIHSQCCKGVISLVGKGGAIRLQKGNLTLIGCLFRNNSARLLGGAIFVDREGDLIVESTTFENSDNDVHTIQGDILYSNGIVSIVSARLLALSAYSHTAILRHSGNHWSIEVTDVSIQCPVGYRLRVTNTSAYGITRTGLRRSYKLDQLSYFCTACERNKYSLDFGYLNYSLTYSSFDYDTLRIDGNKPDIAYNGTYIYHDIECQQCPYGGKCQQGIVAVANFWGYIHDNQVKFQHCPKDYCCSSTDCETYNTCAKHREGNVCGQCEDGYSEALFSSACVPEDECDPTWLWPVALASGILYALFLLFQKDMRDLMYLKTIDIKDLPICRRCRSRRQRSKTDGDQSPSAVGLTTGEPTTDGYVNHEQTEMQVFKAVDVDGDTGTELKAANDAFGKPNNNEKVNGLREKIEEDELFDEGISQNERLTEDPDEQQESASQPQVDTGASFLIILFYYFQDAQLLQVKTVFASTENQSQAMVKEILAGLFKFRVEVFQFMDKFCFLSGLTPTFKLLYKVTLVPYVLLQFGVMYLIYKWCCRRRLVVDVPSEECQQKEDEGEPNSGPPPKTFSSRLATGFVLSLLFTYQMLATTSLTLLNCVPVGDISVLYIEGTIVCYQFWQYGVMAYTASCIVPFCLALLIGPGLVKDGLISLSQFFIACILPLPFLIYWFIIRLRLKGKRPKNKPDLLSESQAVIQILQGPFKDAESKFFGPICGAGILIGRRLLLVLLFTFVNDKLIRMLCMMLICFMILLHHVHVLPYKDTRCNLAGTVSAAALVFVGAINLVRAGFEAAEYIPLGPNAVLMTVFEELENALMLWFPAAVMSIVLIALSIKVPLFLASKFMKTEDVST